MPVTICILLPCVFYSHLNAVEIVWVVGMYVTNLSAVGRRSKCSRRVLRRWASCHCGRSALVTSTLPTTRGCAMHPVSSGPIFVSRPPSRISSSSTTAISRSVVSFLDSDFIDALDDFVDRCCLVNHCLLYTSPSPRD